MIRGMKIELGGDDYVIPPLTIDQLEEFETDIASAARAAIGDAESFGNERMAAMARVIHAALARNYPELALGEVRKLLDLGNIGAAFRAVMGVSNLDEKEKPAGEAKAETPTGAVSAPASALTQAGAGTKPAS